jgi:two-component system sensor histidine kinase MtrB
VTSRDPIAPRTSAVVATADPTALPGNGARVVPRPASGVRQQDDTSGGDAPRGGTAAGAGSGPKDPHGHPEDPNVHSEDPPEQARGSYGQQDSHSQGEAFRGR